MAEFAFPVLLGSLLQQPYNTVDTIIVGRFSSEEALSAVGTTGTLTFFFLAIAMGFSAGNGVVIAQHYGAKNDDGVRKSASSGILFLMILGVVVTYLFRYSPFLEYSVVWWNGLFGFGLGFIITWYYYLSGRWHKSYSEKRQEKDLA